MLCRPQSAYSILIHRNYPLCSQVCGVLNLFTTLHPIIKLRLYHMTSICSSLCCTVKDEISLDFFQRVFVGCLHYISPTLYEIQYQIEMFKL